MAKISVIIPVGNLQRDMSSVRAMCSGDFGDFFEYIVVIDQEKPLKDEEFQSISLPNVTVIQSFNGRPGLTRNEGLRHASGEYVAFWDSDDVIDKETIFQYIKNLETDFEVLIFDYKIKNKFNNEETVIRNFGGISECLRTPAVWRMLFKNDKKWLGYFGKFKCGEDQLFLLTCNLQDRKVAFIPDIFYTYYIHSDSQLSRDSSSLVELANSLEEVNEALEQPEYSNYSNYHFQANLFGSVIKRIYLYNWRNKIRFFLELTKHLNRYTISVFGSRIAEKIEALKPRQYFSLAGGLGNQLFQTAAGFEANPKKVHVVTNLLHVASGTDGKPQVLELNLPFEIVEENRFKFSRVLRKVVNLDLRQISTSRNRFIRNVISILLSLIATLLFSIHNRKYLYLHLNSDLGYRRRIRNFVPTLYVGYFQSNIVVNRFVEIMRFIPITKELPGPELSAYLDLARKMKPILVHVRLGDYKAEPKIGLLCKEYFLDGIKQLQTKVEEGEIWVFSNEPELASSYFETKSAPEVTFVSNSQLSAIETLELMRNMKGYVIGNSTFSWWAARLKYDHSAVVVAPVPWFKSMNDPEGLIPGDWITIEAELK